MQHKNRIYLAVYNLSMYIWALKQAEDECKEVLKARNNHVRYLLMQALAKQWGHGYGPLAPKSSSTAYIHEWTKKKKIILQIFIYKAEKPFICLSAYIPFGSFS